MAASSLARCLWRCTCLACVTIWPTADSRVFLAAGLGASLALVFIGLYPAPSIIHHIATVSVFLCIAVLGAFISRDMRAKSQSRFPRWLIYPGALAAASSVAFVITLILDRGLTPGAFEFAITVLPDEPVVNGVMVLEWLAFFSVQVLALLVAATMRSDAPAPVAR
jgi:hypothetical protein